MGSLDSQVKVTAVSLHCSTAHSSACGLVYLHSWPGLSLLQGWHCHPLTLSTTPCWALSWPPICVEKLPMFP